MRKRDDSGRGGAPERIADMLGRFLRGSGIGDRVKQTEVLSNWAELVGPEIAQATRPVSVSEDGTLFALARTSAWMNELTMMEGELLAAINRVTVARPIRKIRWSLMR